ncbi:DNA-binding protein [Xanthomonas prunicola]|uniref:DNA-binding protein n=7 Tax=Xanthomonas TaxID=338 RepID=A0A2N3RFP6_9XANT|nr:DNA-binding protein [Xanthomonas prunicola]PKV15495.1 DNA-binding protein [Xanthomonas prunicola]PKV19432.1 DNA-binding protein [Xanthomonas prunicola]
MHSSCRSRAMVAVLNPLALTERLRVPDRTILSPSAMAGLLDLSQQELAELAGVHRNSLRVHPESPRVQDLLRNLSRLLVAMAQVQPDERQVVFHLKNTPIPAFEFATLLEVVKQGRTDDALTYLRTVAAGAAG